MDPDSIFWFRRDLSINDNIGLYNALKENKSVQPVFIFDKAILDKLPKDDKRIPLIYSLVKSLKNNFFKLKSNIIITHDSVESFFENIPDTVKRVYTNHDYEPYAIIRDIKIEEILHKKGIELITFKNQVIFEKDEVTKDNGHPYTVFTPYMKKWKQAFKKEMVSECSPEKYSHNLHQFSAPEFDYESMGFSGDAETPPLKIDGEILDDYENTRDYPGIDGTSRMGFALRFGAVSIRKLVREALERNETYLNELIWREFYMMILWHFPHVVNNAFKPAYNHIPWKNNEDHFQKWCEGKTGIPIVDAGMRELNKTGYMHNRVRMIVASFLTKNLLIDWRWGEAYFAEKLLDFELASNNGGWQWAAGTGCDAAPYFRVFNPITQMKKFDPEMAYVKKWVPEYDSKEYPDPIVDLKESRARAIETYSSTLKN